MSSTLENEKENEKEPEMTPLEHFSLLFAGLSAILMSILIIFFSTPSIGDTLTIISVAILFAIFLFIINKLAKFLIQMKKEKIEGFTFLTFLLFGIIFLMIGFLAIFKFFLFTKNLYITPIGLLLFGISTFMMILLTTCLVNFFEENSHSKIFQLSDEGAFSWFLFTLFSSVGSLGLLWYFAIFFTANISL